MWRVAKWIGWILAGLVTLLVLLLVFANTGPGREAIASLAPRLTGDTVRLNGITGRFPDALRIARVELRDPKGDYATVDGLVLDWSPLQLLHGRIVIDRLDAAHVAVLRMPASSSKQQSTVPPIVLHEANFARVDIDQALAGSAVAVALEGSGELLSPSDFKGNLDIRQLDGDGRYSIVGSGDAKQLQARLNAREPAQGLIATLAGLHGLGAIALDATLEGPRDAVATRIALTAGELHATATGTLDLQHDAADLTVAADAPAMQPRPGVSWQSVAINAHVQGPFTKPDASGHLRIASLSAGGSSIEELTADVAGNAGRLHLDGQVSGLRIPGPNPELLAKDPLTIAADARLDAPDRPVQISVQNRLFSVQADALTGNQRRLDASLRLPDLAPFAAMGQVQAQGSLALNLHAGLQDDTTSLTADGTIGITGGQAQASAVVGDDGKFNLAATLRGSDLTVSRLQFTGRAGSFEASGRSGATQLNFAWSFALNDLAAVEPLLAGQLQASGTIAGPMDDLGITAEIGGSVSAQGMSSGPLTVNIEASGLPSHPTGHVIARGDLLNAPVDLAVAMRQAGDVLAIDIQRANWKSLEAGGALQLPMTTLVPTGNLRVAMTRLGDLAPLIGRPVAGSVEATIVAPADAARPTVDAKIDATGLEMGRIGGSIQVSASGAIDALDVKVAAASPDLSGAPARLSAAARLDATGKTVDLASLQAEWRQQTVRLLAPARIGFADGVTIDNLRLGMRQAVLEVAGKAGSRLDLTASLRNLPADIVGADGTVRADARITGTAASPSGKISLAATGLRLRSDMGRAMPPATINADADLNGADARVDARLTAGGSRLGVTGLVPLNAAGRMDLRANGTVNLAMLNPILGAGGRRVSGQVSLDATTTGTIAAPSVSGSVRLTGGEVQDFTSGLHLSDIAGRVEGSGNTLRIAQFSAKAGEGSITAGGSIAVMAPGVPLDLTITARNARPLSSDLITAVVDANLTLRGEALGNLSLGGSIHVLRADIRIPERIPANIAVLPVNRPGAKPAPASAASEIALDIVLQAPEQIFVRGRGVDVEFGGTVKVGGTTAAPRTAGGLDLRRGSISLAGRTLNFTKGQISFDGGSVTDPALNLAATSTSGNVTATLAIGGTAQDPKITLSSVPALPQDEVLAHLLFGTGTGKLGALEVAEIAAGLATLTGSGGIGDPLDKVRQGLGLDRLSVTNGPNGSPAVEAGRYVAPRVYIGARQSSSGASQAKVQFDITKRLKLQATAGTGTTSATGTASESNGSGVGLTYQFEY